MKVHEKIRIDDHNDMTKPEILIYHNILLKNRIDAIMLELIIERPTKKTKK